MQDSTNTARIKAILVNKYTNAVMPNTTIHLLNAVEATTISDFEGNIEFKIVVNYNLHQTIEITMEEDDYSFINVQVNYQ